MDDGNIIVIGAGLAGLSCARMLADAGRAVVVLDKGRGIGGRLSTRRTKDGWQFDHGAQYVRAVSDGFEALLTKMMEQGDAETWDNGSDMRPFVGVPGMTALAKFIGAGLDIRLKTQVTRVSPTDAGWMVTDGTDIWPCRRVVITTPAPQIAPLVEDDGIIAGKIASVRMAPCLTLMAAFEGDRPAAFAYRRDPTDPIAWIAHDGSKPGRPHTNAWVAQAGPEWSLENLELDPAEIARRMVPMLCDRIGADEGAVRYATAHRWRYATVTDPLKEPFVRNDARTLYAGGDWCLGPLAEAAWASGSAIADDILRQE